MAEVNREWIVRELRELLIALASPGEVALEHAPPGSCRPDELALDYDNFVHAFVGNFSAETSVQSAALYSEWMSSSARWAASTKAISGPSPRS